MGLRCLQFIRRMRRGLVCLCVAGRCLGGWCFCFSSWGNDIVLGHVCSGWMYSTDVNNTLVCECLFVCETACMCGVRQCFPSEFSLGTAKQHLDHVILIEHDSKANSNGLILGRVAVPRGSVAHPVSPVVKETLVLTCVCVFVTYPERCSCPCWRWGLGCGPCPCLWGWSCFRRTDSVSGTSGSEEARLSWVWLRGSMAVWILPPVSRTDATVVNGSGSVSM